MTLHARLQQRDTEQGGCQYDWLDEKSASDLTFLKSFKVFN